MTTSKNDTYNATVGQKVNVNVLSNDSAGVSISAINGIAMEAGWTTWVDGVGLVTVNSNGTLDIASEYANPADFTYTVTSASGAKSVATVSANSGGSTNSAVDGTINVEYFNVAASAQSLADVNFNAPAIFHETINSIQENAGTNSFYNGGPVDQFAAHYTSEFSVDVAGEYTFYLNSDDGSRLSIDGKQVINNDKLHAAKEIATTVHLSAGVHKLDAKYFEQTGGAVMELDWKGPGFGRSTFEVNGAGGGNGGGNGGANVAPDAIDDSYTVAAGKTTVLHVLSNDKDANGDSLSITQINGVDMFAGWDTWVDGVGLVTLNSNGTVSVQPADDATWGSFQYTVSDGKGGIDKATVKLDVGQATNPTPTPTPTPNRAPDARDDSGSAKEGNKIVINALSNDTDPDGNPLSITHVGGKDIVGGQTVQLANIGAVKLLHGGVLEIQPYKNVDTAAFNYKVSDGKGGFDEARVSFNVLEAPNKGPLAHDDMYRPNPGDTYSFDPLKNDTDPNGDALTISQVDGQNIKVGQSVFVKFVGNVKLEHNGTLTLDPLPGLDIVSFDYTISDGKGGTDIGRIAVDVQHIANNAPDASNDYAKVQTGFWLWDRKDVKINLAGNDSDQDGDIASITKIAGQNIRPGQTISVDGIGKIKLYDNGTVKVYPKDWMKDTKFTYELTDEHGATDTAVVHLDVTGFFSGIVGGIAAAVGIAAVATGVVAAGIAGALILPALFTPVTPVALDLNEDGEIGVTGATSSFEKDNDAELGRTVEFDIDADGELETIEWFDGSGDGILIDTTKIKEDGSIDGSALFGAIEGQYEHGYEKLAEHDANADGMLEGDELVDLALWLDDGDGVLEEGELKTIEEENIASISTEMEIVKGEDGKALMQSSATKEDGTEIISEDVWFLGYEGTVSADADAQAEVNEMAMAQQEEVIIEDMMM